MALTIISFILVLGALVFFHELGHYLVARRNGIEVEEFGIGYPPRLVKLGHYDGTDFTLNALPLGGFARMKGEDAGDMSPGSFNAASIGARASTLIAGPAMNFLLAVVLFAVTAMSGVPAMAGHPQLSAAPAGSAAAQLGLQTGDILMALDAMPINVSVSKDAHISLSLPAAGASTLTVGRGDQTVEVANADSNLVRQVIADGQFTPVLVTEITGVVKDSPAELSGIKAGDLVLKVNDTLITAERPLYEEIQQHLGETIALIMWRDGAWIETTVTPRASPPPGQGAIGVQIGAVTEMAQLGIVPAILDGFQNTIQYISMVVQLPALLLMGRMSPDEAQLTGPVGIAQMVGGAVSATLDTGFWFPILQLSAVLSAALAITNLLPLPALDGGRLLFIAIEAVRGRRVNPEREGFIHMVGFVLLLGLMILITVRDLSTTPQTIDWAKLMGQ